MKRREFIEAVAAAGVACLCPLGTAEADPPPFRETWVHRDGQMVQVRMFELKPGDVFLIREAGTENIVGNAYWKATSEPWEKTINGKHTWGIEAQEHQEYTA